MPLMTVTQYAAHRGISHQAVSKAVAEKKIKRDRRGKIDSDKADLAWSLRTNPILPGSRTAGPGPQRPASPPSPAPSPSPQSATPAPPVSYVAEHLGLSEKLDLKTKMAHLREKEARAESAEMERDVKRNALMKRSVVDEHIAFFSQMVRDHMMAMPDRLSPALAAVNDPAAAHRILKNDVDAALRKLSKAIASAGF